MRICNPPPSPFRKGGLIGSERLLFDNRLIFIDSDPISYLLKTKRKSNR